MTKNIKIMLALFAIAMLYTFVLGCEDTVTVTVEGEIEDWNVTGVDSAIEKMAEPVLDFGDALVDIARDTEEAAIDWGFDNTTGGE